MVGAIVAIVAVTIVSVALVICAIVGIVVVAFVLVVVVVLDVQVMVKSLHLRKFNFASNFFAIHFLLKAKFIFYADTAIWIL